MKKGGKAAKGKVEEGILSSVGTHQPTFLAAKKHSDFVGGLKTDETSMECLFFASNFHTIKA